MTALLAAVACTALLLPGPHHIECTAYYAHTLADGDRYESTDIITGTSADPVNATCGGEGHPERVRMIDNGEEVCVEDKVLFEDGFEGGDTGAWQ